MEPAGHLAERRPSTLSIVSTVTEDPTPNQTSAKWSAESLMRAVLPAATSNEVLQRLAGTISAEALFVKRLRWPQWLCVEHAPDGELKARVVDEADVPDGDLCIGPARVVGDHDSFDEHAFELLVRQAQSLDAHQLDEKLASMAELAAGAGHEVNNPLGSIVGRATLLLKGEDDPERRRTLASIVSQAYRGRDMIGDLMLFARPPAAIPEAVNVAEALDEVVGEFADDLRDRNLTVAGECDRSLSVWGDATQFRIVLCELIRNSLHFAPENTSIEISTSRLEDDALVSVFDRGSMLSETEKRHLFDPFFSGRQAGRGLGFGLTKCWRIVTLHGGCITYDEVGGVNLFQFRWPICGAASDGA